MNQVNLQQFEEQIGHVFNNKNLLVEALTHRSYLNEHPDFEINHNERLEFLGDAVLELIVTEELYKKFDIDEGLLTNLRAALVNAKMCADIANAVGIEPFLLLSRGEQKDAGTKARMYILANALEAVIGAIYLDAGYAKASDFVHRFVLIRLPYVLEHQLFIDPKSRFQEIAQELVGITPNYKVLSETGPDHDRHFTVGIFLDKELVASGVGSSKQEAQEHAAREALKAKNWDKLEPTKKLPS